MPKKIFSTGLDQIDRYLGGIEKGDSLIWFTDRPRDVQPILRHLLSYCREQKIRVIPVLAAASLSPIPLTDEDYPPYVTSTKPLRPSSRISSAKRFLAGTGRNSCILVDDLALWKRLFRSESLVAEFFTVLRDIAASKGSFLVTTVDRRAFSSETLVALKDAASIALDLIERDGELFCVPLSTVGKYVPNRVYPLSLRIDRLMGQGPSKKEASRKPSLTVSDRGPEISEKLLASIRQDVFSSDERYKTLFENAGTPMILFHGKHGYREANKRLSEVLGFSAEEVKELPATTFISPESRIAALRAIAQLPQKRRMTMPLTLLKKSGEHLAVEAKISSLGGGWYLCLLSDSSARRSEIALRKTIDDISRWEQSYREIVEKASFGIGIIIGSRLTYANRTFLQLSKYSTIEDIRSKKVFELFTGENASQLKRVLRALTTAGGRATREAEVSADSGIELNVLCADGSVAACKADLARITYGGKDAVRISLMDVTAEKAFLSQLTAAEQRFRTLVENADEAMAVVRDGSLVYVNPAFARMFGYPSGDDALARDVGSVVDVSQRDNFERTVKKIETGQAAPTVQIVRGIRQDQSTLDVEVTFARIKYGDDDALLTFCRDCTERKQIEETLQLQIREAQLVDSIISSVSESLDVSRVIDTGLRKIIESFGYQGGAVYVADSEEGELRLAVEHGLAEKIANSLRFLPRGEGIAGLAAKTQEPHQYTMDEYPSFLPYKSLFADAGVRVVTLVPLLAKSSVNGLILLISRSLLEPHSFRRVFTALGKHIGAAVVNAQGQQELVQTIERHRQLIKSLPDVIYTRAPDGTVLFVTENVEEFTGYQQSEFYRNRSLWLSIIHPDDKKQLLSLMANLNESRDETVLEYRILPRGKAEYRWMHDSIALLRDESGSVVSMNGILSDVTANRILHEALRESEEFKSSILAGIQEGVAIVDRQMKCVQWNDALESITGIGKDDAVGFPADAAFTFVDGVEVQRILERALAGQLVNTDDLRFRNARTGREGFVWFRCSPFRNAQGDITGAVCFVSDVTERKKLEQNYRDSEQILRNVIDTMGDVLVLADLKGTVIEVNKQFLRSLGYTRAEAIGREFPYPWLLEEEMGRFVLWIASLREKNYLHDFDMTWRAKDGKLIPMSLTTTLLRNSYGEPIAMLNLARDITERKKLVEELESRTKQLELLNRIISKANQTMDFGEIFRAVALETRNVIAFDELNVALVSPDRQSFDVYVFDAEKVEVKEKTRIALEETVSRIALELEEPVVIADFTADERYQHLRSAREGYRSQISTPFSSKGTILGTLSLVSREPSMYAKNQLAFLEPLAQQIGTAADRISLFKQVTEDAQYIHNLLNSIDSAVYTIDDKKIVREANRAWHYLVRRSAKPASIAKTGIPYDKALPTEDLKAELEPVVDRLLAGSLNYYSHEFVQGEGDEQYSYHLTANPMVIEGRTTGVVFTYTDVTELKRTEAELKKRNEQLLVLNEISTTLSTSIDFENILSSVLPRMAAVLGADIVLLYLMDSSSTDLVLSHQVGLPESKTQLLRRLPTVGTATGAAVTSKKSIYIEVGALHDERVSPTIKSILREIGWEALAIIPLRVKDKVYGALDVLYKSPHLFREQERQVLTLVGNQFGSAIENAQLYSQLHQQIDRLTVLYTLSQQLTSTLEVDHILRSVSEHIPAILPLRHCVIHLFDEKAETVTKSLYAEVKNGQQEMIRSIRQGEKVEEDSAEWTALTEHRSVHEFRPPTDDDEEGVARMCVPMTSNEKIIGIISATNIGAGAYSDTQLRLLESIGNLAALALEKASLYEEIVRKSLEIERRNKELDDFTYVVSHDLKEPLIAIEGYSKILLKDFYDTFDETGRSYLDTISHSSTRMKRLIEDLLLLSWVGRVRESFTRVSMREVANEVLRELRFLVQQKNARVTVADHLPDVLGNATQLEVVLRNLVSNALKFNASPEPRVEIGWQSENNHTYVFFVRDNGIGIDQEFFEKIFVVFQRLHTREEYEGTGAGLAIVKKILELHRGRIWVESEKGKGSTFYFSIPEESKEEGVQ